jgi:aspartate/methionine/tyrosine aminotransferase
MKSSPYPAMQLSTRVKDIPEALSIYINQLVYDQKRKGKDLTVLSFGEAFFDIPMFSFSKLDFVKGYHYSDSRGIPELREKIATFYKRQYQAEINAKDEILVTAGSKPAIFFAMQATLNPGDEVIIHEPGWLSYQEQARLVGAVPQFIPYDCPIQDFHKHFTDKTRMLIINNPNNPAGRAYLRRELNSIYEQCRPLGIYVLVDEAYSDFVIEEKFHSMAEVVPDKDGIIVVNSLSKNMGMSGWRVGYVVGAPPLINEILKVNQHLITCAPTILQYYMAQYFDDVTAITLPQVREMVAKRTRIGNLMDEIGLKRMAGGSTFYFLVNIENFPGSSLDFALDLLFNHQIGVVPGSAYGKSTERFIRVGVGTESEERIHDALLVIKDLINTKTRAQSIVPEMVEKEVNAVNKEIKKIVGIEESTEKEEKDSKAGKEGCKLSEAKV